ncbi:MAG: metal-dependent transcriptional regulator [Spirochaetales bacterium]|nr:metal-dependent transcriptional regulator [Spirochaetales bacterium]
MLSESQEDYLKQIYLLIEDPQGIVGTQALAERIGVAPASATAMLHKLRALGLVHYAEYRGVSLTESGRKVALELLRHHRLLESFLQTALGYGWEEVHDEAERLEHYISETFETRMALWLGEPEFDPHGDPIPNADLVFPVVRTETSLTKLGAGFEGQIVRVATQDRDELNLLSHLHLLPGRFVKIAESGSNGVRLNVLNVDTSRQGNHFLIPLSLAARIFLQEGQPS